MSHRINYLLSAVALSALVLASAEAQAKPTTTLPPCKTAGRAFWEASVVVVPFQSSSFQ